ncbi:acyl carrier protein [Kitasatospora sp. NPDC059599]|uniref:acyl carrier protein n=1 Tax=Kitasatospora sp. NPDC059599 TaxID=3346880 RepID=UPI00369FD392
MRTDPVQAPTPTTPPTERDPIAVSATSSPQQNTTEIETGLLAFLESRVKVPVDPETDLFASGAVTSLFSLELVVHVETAYGVAVGGADLTLDNFRTVRAMTALVGRLRADTMGGTDA